MADLNWPDFNNELGKHLKKVNDTFLSKALPFDDGLFQDKEGDDETDEQKRTMEQKLEGVLKKGEKGKADLLQIVNLILDKKNARIKALKEAFRSNQDKINNEYDKNKESCKESWQAINGYLDDKEGFIHFLSEAFQNQHNELNELKDVREIVAKKKNEFDNLFSCKFFCFALLIFGCIIAQVFLFSKLTECGGQSDDVLVKCILVAAMIVLFVCEVYSILGIFRLSRKKTNILQRLDLIMNKIDMRKVSKFEIDRDFEKVLEEMK